MKHFSVPILATILGGVLQIASSIALAESGSKKSQWLSDWEEAGQEDGIRAVCRQHQTNINQCKFRYLSNVPAEALTSVILDVDHFTEWAESVSLSKRVFAEEDPGQLYVYTNYDFIGASDRDAVTLYTPNYDHAGKRMRITFQTVDRDVPKRDMRLVRFPLMAGYWQFTELPSGQTEIEHLSFTLPGGVVQKTLYYPYNIAYVDASFVTIKALEQQARKHKYQQLTDLNDLSDVLGAN